MSWVIWLVWQTALGEPVFEVVVPGGVLATGTPMTVQLVFHAPVGDTYVLDGGTYDRGGRMHSEQWILEPPAPDPLRELGFGDEGGIRNMPVLSPTPVVIERDLAEYARLQPGNYTLTVRTSRVTSRDGAVPLVSEPVHLTVVETAPEELRRRAEAAAQVLAAAAESSTAHVEAAETLRYLEVEAAVAPMVAHFGLPTPDYGDTVLYYGLVRSPHRDLVIAGMEQALIDPGRAVTEDFLDTLAWLRARAGPSRLDSGRAPGSSPGALARARVAAALAAALPHKAPAVRAACVDALRAFAPEAAGDEPLALEQLAPDRQRDLLRGDWTALADPDALRTTLEHLARAPDTEAEVRVLCWWRLLDLDPRLARALILEEIFREDPLTDHYVDPAIALLTSLPDATLPGFDDVLAARAAEPGGWTEREWRLVARYGSPALAEPAELLLADRPTTPGIAYLLRVDPVAGERALVRAFRGRSGAYRAHELRDLSELTCAPAVERMAMDWLRSRDHQRLTPGARALERCGGPMAEQALWDVLELHHARWAGEPDTVLDGPLALTRELSPSAVAAELSAALARGRGWYQDEAFFDRLRSLGLTDAGRGRRWSNERDDTILSAWAYGPGVSWFEVGPIRLDSLEAVRARLALYPPGSTFRMSVSAEGLTPIEDQLRAIATELGHAVQVVQRAPRNPPVVP